MTANGLNRYCIFIALIIYGGVASVVLHAQEARKPGKEDDPKTLSAFEVSTSAGKGYVTGNAASALKTNQSIMKLPQPITVLTRDLIDDTAGIDTSQVLKFVGATSFFRGESIMLRGTRISNALVDEVSSAVAYMDNATVDSMEVIKGPAAVLYGTRADLGGIVLKTTKKPLAISQHTVSLRADELGMYRGEIDSTGPIGSIGEGRFSYRLIGVYQDGEVFRKNMKDKRQVIAPSMQLNYKNTLVRVQHEYQIFDHNPWSINFVTPQGKLYYGAGRDEGYFASWSNEHTKAYTTRATLLHTFTPGWEMRLMLHDYSYHRNSKQLFSSAGINWNDQTIGWNRSVADLHQRSYGYTADFKGEFTTGKLVHQGAAGLYSNFSVNNNKNFIVSNFANPSRRPIDNPVVDSIPETPDSSILRNPTVPGTRNNSSGINLYYSHTVEVIPDKLILVGGLSRFSAEVSNVVNTGIIPNTANTTRGDFTLNRIGAVFSPLKQVSLFASSATNATVQSQLNINRQLLPPQESDGTSYGVKFSLFGGNLSSTISNFKNTTTNVAVFRGQTGTPLFSYFEPVGTTVNDGWDGDITWLVTRNWQLIATFYSGDVKDVNGVQPPSSFTSSWSLLTRYDFRAGALKGFGFGVGATRIGGRTTPGTSAQFITPTPVPTIKLDEATEYNLFVTYTKNNWSLRLNVENLTDEIYPISAQAAWLVDPSQPRTISLMSTYRF